MKKRLPLFLFLFSASAWTGDAAVLDFPKPAQVQWQGILAPGIADNHHKRLHRFIEDEHGVIMRLFSEEGAEGNTFGRYWGEHAGKWLFASSRAAARTGDRALEEKVRRIADYLVSRQEPDGYIGTYPREWRFMNRQREMRRRWDVWVAAYVIMGLLEVNRHFPDERYVSASRRLADLCWETFSAGEIKITDLSNHYGLSATILLEPVADLYGLTREPRYLKLAELIVRQADERPEFQLVKRTLAGADVHAIAGGKAYQLCWQFLGLARLHRVTGDPQYLQMARNAAENIRQHHLTLGGGPWGGIGVHRETFNPQGFFSPQGFVETCSTMSWIQLNRELLALTGETGYAEEIERAAYNALLGAQDENGEDWCYYTFPNGKRVNTSEWKCCKSSGSMALEELTPVAYALRAGSEIVVNLYGPNQATFDLPAAGTVAVRQETRYPFDGDVRLEIAPSQPAEFTVAVRIPSWAQGATVTVNGKPAGDPVPGRHVEILRRWARGDVVALSFPMRPVLHRRTNQSLQDSNLRIGDEPVMDVVMRYDYVAITRGPLVYATELIDGFKQEETLRLPADRSGLLTEIPAVSPEAAPAVRFSPAGRSPLVFTPWYRTGGRRDGVWRLTWMQIADATP